MRHPAQNFIRYLIVKDPTSTDADIYKVLEDWGFLKPQDTYLGFLRQEVGVPPPNFDPINKLHRPSMRYLRDQQVYELFFPSPAVEEAWENLTDPNRRITIEQILLSGLDPKMAAQKINQKHNWHLTEDGIKAHGHFFWNVKLLSFEQWGRFLYERHSLYDTYMSLLRAPPQLAMYHLRMEQTLDSKKMIKTVQDIAFHTYVEVSQLPGVRTDKIKSMSMLSKTITDCHASLSTSDMALSSVLKEFERFRMTHAQLPAPDIHQLAPAGNYSGSGIEDEVPEEKKERMN